MTQDKKQHIPWLSTILAISLITLVLAGSTVKEYAQNRKETTPTLTSRQTQNSIAIATIVTPNQDHRRETPCTSDPESVVCLKFRIDQLEARSRNLGQWVRKLEKSGLSSRELEDLRAAISELKSMIGTPQSRRIEGNKSDVGNLWMEVNGIKDRLNRARID